MTTKREFKVRKIQSVLVCLAHHLELHPPDEELVMNACGGCDEQGLCRKLWKKIKEDGGK